MPVLLTTSHSSFGTCMAETCVALSSPQLLCLHVQDQKQKPDSDFEPNLVNTVCFVVNFIIQLSTFACNYQGAPFNTPIKETKGFFNMLKYSYIFCLAVTYNFLGIGTAFSLVRLILGSTELLRQPLPQRTHMSQQHASCSFCMPVMP